MVKKAIANKKRGFLRFLIKDYRAFTQKLVVLIVVFSFVSLTNLSFPLGSFSFSLSAKAEASGQDVIFVSKWGSSGTGDGQFNQPNGIAVDDAGNVYVVDTWNSRIQKFSSDGNFIKKWGVGGRPRGIAVDRSGNVYVTTSYLSGDYSFVGVRKFTVDGALHQ